MASILAIQCTNGAVTPTAAVQAPRQCVSGATHPLGQFALVRGYITYSDLTEIWAVDPNHPSNRVSLGVSNGLDPIAWSRDGSRLLLSEQGGYGRQFGFKRDLCVMNADGSRTRLTSDGLSGEGSFSPDGGQVAFAQSDQGLYVVDAKGGTPRLIEPLTGLEFPTWSPDGSRIGFMVYLEFGLSYEIWTVKPDGTDSRQLVDLGTCGRSGCSGGLVWSPDGSMLAFHSRWGPLGPDGQKERAPAIYVVRADGTGLHRINDSGRQPSWSPDGSRLGFMYGADLFTMATDGSDQRHVESLAAVFPTQQAWTWNPAK